MKRAKAAAAETNNKSEDADGTKKRVVKKSTNADDDATVDAELAEGNDDEKCVKAEGDENNDEATDNKGADKAGLIDSNTADAERKLDADKTEKKLKPKIDDKEKMRKKHVRLWCVHCRIECATFKVNSNGNPKYGWRLEAPLANHK